MPASPGAASPPITPAELASALSVADPWLQAEINQILENPIRLQRPDLRHFAPVAKPNTANGWTLFGLLNDNGLGMALSLGALTLLASGALVLRFRGEIPARVRRAALIAPFALALPLSAAAAAAGVIGHTATPVHTLSHPAQQVSAVSAPSTKLRPLVAQTATNQNSSPGWQSLLNIESTIIQRHDALVANESGVASRGALLQRELLSDPGRPQVIPALKAEINSLLHMHGGLATAYEQSLQSEYEFFVAAAQSPLLLTEVQAGAVTSTPAVVQAVAYDLAIVQTQLAQETTIAWAAQAGAPLPPSTGPVSFHAPVSGQVSQGFGPTSFYMEPPLKYNGVFYRHFHTGLDIGAPRGTPVGAAADGVVLLATSSVDGSGNFVGYGNYVVIQHADGFLTLYGHLDKLLVHTGQAVTQGQVIGLLGSTGWSTGPHLHFEIRLNGVYVDPARYL